MGLGSVLDALTGKTKAKPKQRTKSVLILDRSGSMGRFRDEAVEGFNAQLEIARASSTPDHEILVSLVMFSRRYTHLPDVETILWNVPAAEVQPITREQFVPNGDTNLFDTIADVVDRLKAEPDADDPNLAYLITTVTDGAENASARFPRAKTAEFGAYLRTLEAARRWTFPFVGANLDLGLLQKDITVFKGNAVEFEAKTGGVLRAMHFANAASSDFYASRGAGVMCSASYFGGAAKVEDEPLAPPAPNVAWDIQGKVDPGTT
jgi:hypothetical protein